MQMLFFSCRSTGFILLFAALTEPLNPFCYLLRRGFSAFCFSPLTALPFLIPAWPATANILLGSCYNNGKESA